MHGHHNYTCFQVMHFSLDVSAIPELCTSMPNKPGSLNFFERIPMYIIIRWMIPSITRTVKLNILQDC